MDQLNIVPGFVFANHDFRFLQDSIEESLYRLLAASSDIDVFSDSGAVITGFNVEIENTTTIKLYNNNSINSGFFVNREGKIVRFSPELTSGVTYELNSDNIIDDQAPQPSITYFICVRYIDRLATEGVETPGFDYDTPGRVSLIENVPGNSGGLYHDRRISSFELKFIPDSQFSSIQLTSSNSWTLIGKVSTNVDSELVVDSEDFIDVTFLSAIVRDSSIGVDKLEIELQQLLELLFVQLDYPTFALLEGGFTNRFLFSDVPRQLTTNQGQNLVLSDGDLGVVEPVVFESPDIVRGARIIKTNALNAASPVSLSGTFGGSGSVEWGFTITPQDNFNNQYSIRPAGVSVFIESINPGVSGANDQIEIRIIRTSDSTVMWTGGKPRSQIVENSWNVLPIIGSGLNLAVGTGYTLQVRRNPNIAGAVIQGNSSNDFRVKLFFQPPQGQFGERAANRSIRIYDRYGPVEVHSEERFLNEGISRYIPYGADLSSPSTFQPYVEPVYEDPDFVRHYVAVDPIRGRFYFRSGEQPVEPFQVYISCNYYIKHSELNAMTLQRKSRRDEFFFENIESALERISQISQAFLVVRKVRSPLLVASLPDNTYTALSRSVNFTDSSGSVLPVERGALPEVQLKIDSFFTGTDSIFFESDLQLTGSPINPRRSGAYINYALTPDISDGDIIHLNGVNYEFDSDNTVTFGNVRVDIGANNDQSISNLVTAITDQEDDYFIVEFDSVSANVKISRNSYGTSGNFIELYVVQDTNNIFELRNFDNTIAGTGLLTGGRLGTYIEFVPRFVQHKGIVLFTGDIVYNPPTDNFELQIRLQKGTFDNPVGTEFICTIPATNIVPNSVVFIEFTTANTVPPTPPLLDINDPYFYRVNVTNVVGNGSINIKRFASVPYNFVNKDDSFSDTDLDVNGDLIINHDFDDNYPIVAVYTDTGEKLLPDYIELLDSNSLKVGMNSFAPFSDYNYLVLSAQRSTTKYDVPSFADTDLVGGELVINHGLDTLTPAVLVFNDNNEQVLPDIITVSDNNTVVIDMTDFGTFTGYRVRVADTVGFSQTFNTPLFSSYSQQFINSDVSSGTIDIQHNLRFLSPEVILYRDDGNIVYPDSINSLDENNISIDLGFYSPINGVWRVVCFSPVLSDGEVSDGQIKYQEIFESVTGVATTSIGYDVFDDTGSLFLPSEGRSLTFDNQNINFTSDPSLTDWQVQSNYDNNSRFPNFTPSSLDTVYTSSFRVFVSEWDGLDVLGSSLTYRVIDNQTNSIIGDEQTRTFSEIEDILGNNPLVNPILPVTDPNDLVEVILPYVTPPLSLSRSYRLEVRYNGASGNFFLATDGTVSGTFNKCYRRYYAATYIPLQLGLPDGAWENVRLPTPYYVAIDITRGRFKFHPDAPLELVNLSQPVLSFFFRVAFPELNSEAINRPNGLTVEDTFLEYRNYIITGEFFGWDYTKVIGTGTLTQPQYDKFSKDDFVLQIEYIYGDGSVALGGPESNGRIHNKIYRFSVNTGSSFGVLASEIISYDSGEIIAKVWQ